MAEYLIQDSTLSDIADAIREKTCSAESMTPAQMASAIAAIETGDIDFIRQIPGVGKKTASQIILDLKGKLVESENVGNDDLNDVAEALKQLGYKPAEIRPVIRKLANEKGSTDELIRKALALLMK